MHPVALTILLLSLSNVFMTFAWYAHLKELSHKPWIVAALISWGIAFFEYMLQVPANRIGYSVLAAGQLKLLQEVITLSIFVPFALFYLMESDPIDVLMLTPTELLITAVILALAVMYATLRRRRRGRLRAPRRFDSVEEARIWLDTVSLAKGEQITITISRAEIARAKSLPRDDL